MDAARLEDRSIVLMWAMRGTLHLVTAQDYGWLRPLVLEPQIANAHRRLRQLGLAGDQPTKAERAVERMLGRHGPLTRREILDLGTPDELTAASFSVGEGHVESLT